MARKTISLPGYYDLDIAPILPIVDSTIFQRLRFIKQLGINYLIFPSALHTRFEHSLGAYSLMLERTRHWQMDEMITQEEAINLRLLALLHDIGHGPYSHITEVLCHQDHNQHGLCLIGELQHEIEACGGNISLLRRLLVRSHPLCSANCHRPLGTDKLDYVKRDALYTTSAAGFRMGDLLNHVHWINQQLVVDVKFLPEVMQLLLDYVNMHNRVYFRKGADIVSCFLQQIVARALSTGDLTHASLPNLTDSQLDAALLHARDPVVRQSFDRLLFRRLPKAAIILRAAEAPTPTSTKGDHIAVFQVPMKQLDRFAACHQRATAMVHEGNIASLIGLPPEAVLLTPVAHRDRFTPETITVCDQRTGIIGTLHECYPQQWASLQEIISGCLAVRVCVPVEWREKVASPSVASRIFEYLMQV